MKKTILALLLASGSALASPITYSTSGAFSGTDCTASGCTNGGATISFTAVAATNVNSPTGISLGTINVNGGTGSFDGTDKFTLTINQTNPSSGSGLSSTAISGSISSTSNSIVLTFAPATFSIGTSNYALQSTYFLVAPNSNSGSTTLQGSVTTSASAVTPEPASLSLVGIALAGIAFAYRRKFLIADSFAS